MQSHFTLSTSMMRRLISTFPGADDGRLTLNLGALGVATLSARELYFGNDLVQVPLVIHPTGNPKTDGIDMNVTLTHWRVQDEVIWFRMNRMGLMHGAIFQSVLNAIFSLLAKFAGLTKDGRSIFRWNEGQFGIPVNAFLEDWLDFHIPIQVADIVIDHGLTIDLR